MTIDEELQRAMRDTWGLVDFENLGPEVEDFLEMLGRIGPVTAWNLALREHRKRVADMEPSYDPATQEQWGAPPPH